MAARMPGFDPMVKKVRSIPSQISIDKFAGRYVLGDHEESIQRRCRHGVGPRFTKRRCNRQATCSLAEKRGLLTPDDNLGDHLIG